MIKKPILWLFFYTKRKKMLNNVENSAIISIVAYEGRDIDDKGNR